MISYDSIDLGSEIFRRCPRFSWNTFEKTMCVGQEITDIYDECQRILHAADGAVPENDDADDAVNGEHPAEAEGQRIGKEAVALNPSRTSGTW